MNAVYLLFAYSFRDSQQGGLHDCVAIRHDIDELIAIIQNWDNCPEGKYFQRSFPAISLEIAKIEGLEWEIVQRYEYNERLDENYKLLNAETGEIVFP